LPGSPSEGAVNVVVCGSLHRLEAVLVNSTHLLGSGFRRRNGNVLTAKEISAEIRRLLSTTPGVQDLRPSQLLLMTEEQAAPQESVQRLALINELTQAIDLPVLGADLESLESRFTSAHPTEQLDLPHLQSRGFLSLVSQMLAVGDRKTPHINLHAPRQPQPVQDRRKQTIIGGALVAVLVLGVAFWMWRANLVNLNDEIEALQSRKAAADKLIKDRGGVLKQVAAIDNYGQRSLGLSRHLSELMQAMPTRETLLFTQWRAVPLTGTSHSRIIAAGLAKSRQDVELFTEKMDKAGLIVRPPVIRNQEKVKGYAFEFDLDYEIPVQPEVNPLSPEKLPPDITASALPADNPGDPPAAAR